MTTIRKNDAEKVYRALQAITDIPLPQDGTGAKTASSKGILGFISDMRSAHLYINNIRWSIGYDEEIEEKDVAALEKIASDAKKEGA